MSYEEIAEKMLADHEATLTVGTRVRIMPGEGCESLWCKRIDIREGVILGIMEPLRNDPRWDQHEYRVWDEIRLRTGYYCAAELAPIDPPAAPPEDR